MRTGRRRPALPLADAPMACWHALEISDAVVTALSPQRKDGALRIHASQDPSGGRYFNRPAEDLAPTSLHAIHRHGDGADVEGIKAERDRLDRGLGKHAADSLPSGGEQLVCA